MIVCNAAVGKNRIERCGVPAVTVSDQVGHGGVSVLQVHDQVPGHLGGPGCGGVCGRAEDADAAGGVLDDCENVESRSGQGADFTEVGSEEGVCLAAQEGGPGQVIAVRRRLDAVDLEDLPDGGGGDLESQDGEFAVDSAVSPAGVVVRQAQDENSDAVDGGASAGSFGARCAGVAAAQQVTVPAQDGVGGDDQMELSQGGSGDLVEQGSEERPVGRGEPWFIDSTLQDGELVA